MKIARRFSVIFFILLLFVLACNFPLYTARVPAPSQSPALTPSNTAFQPGLTPEDPIPTDSAATPKDATPTGPPETLSPETAPFYQPVFEPAGCAFPLPAGSDPECGYLVLPENRSRADSPSIRLHVAVFRNQAGRQDAYPVIHLAGGPGSSSLEVAGYMFQRGLGAVLEEHDLILFDQRGTGFSQPRLDCPERQALTGRLLANNFSRDEEQSLILEAFRACRERLIAEGIDLSAYNSAASAADVNDLRLALGYPALNLYAVSYGTRLALTVLRDTPQSVRSALLDSAYPLQVNLYTGLAPNAERAFRAFFDLCAGDPACSERYPQLEATFYDLVDRLNASPLPVRLTAGGEAGRTVLVDGGLLIDVLFVGLYNPAVTASMPRMIAGLNRGDSSILVDRLALYFDDSPALGMQMSVQCAEELSFDAPEEAYRAAQGRQPQIAAFFPDSVQPLFAACREWSPVPPDPRENQPVLSDLPVLILAGQLDPITPPAWGRLAAGDLSQARFYQFPGHGHWVTRSSDCALSMALAFWEDPGAPLDEGCLQAEAELDWR